MKIRTLCIISSCFVGLVAQSHATLFDNGKASLSLGGFGINQGKAQHINILGLIGNDYSVTKQNDSNVLFGLGYLIGNDSPFSIGVEAFYLAKTRVQGVVTQESLFSNLAYQYSVTHLPLYAAAKATLPMSNNKFAFALHGGLGVNFMRVSGYRESSLDGMTLPDNAFTAKTNTVFSASAGAGIQLNNVFGAAPLECGYRFYYLGHGSFSSPNSQVLNTVSTGDAYANALVCSIIV